MKALLCALTLAACADAFAQDVVSGWLPLEPGNQWIYQHESRGTPRAHPRIARWRTVETITGTLTIPEGTVVQRDVAVQGDRPAGWLQNVFGEGNFLLRGGCLYFLDAQTWDENKQSLRPEYRARLLGGGEGPEFCFPLSVGEKFSKDASGPSSARVVGRGRNYAFAPSSVSEKAFDVVMHVASGDETHLWFEQGVGITGLWNWHHGTYDEYRVGLLRFRRAHPPAR